MIIDTNFQTPDFVIDYMISLLPKLKMTILEPTPGLQKIVKKLNDLGWYDVTAPKDYFLMEKKYFGAVIGNLPFSDKTAFLDNAPAEFPKKGMHVGYEILKDCMTMSDILVMVVPWFTLLDSDVRMRYLKSFGLVSVTPLPRKTFDYARIQTAVIFMKKGYSGPTEFNTQFFHK